MPEHYNDGLNKMIYIHPKPEVPSASGVMDRFDTIAPVSPRFFGAVSRDPLLSNTARANIVEGALQGRMQLEEVRSKLVSSRQQEELNRLRIERDRFMLDEARRKAQFERDAMAGVGGVADEFNNILGDASLSDDEKHLALDKVRFDRSAAFVHSPVLRDKYEAAKNRLQPRLSETEKRLRQQAADRDAYYQGKAEREAIEAQQKDRKVQVDALDKSLGDNVSFLDDLEFEQRAPTKEEAKEQQLSIGDKVDTDNLADPAFRSRMDRIVQDNQAFAPELAEAYRAAKNDRERRAVAMQLMEIVRGVVNFERLSIGPMDLTGQAAAEEKLDALGVPKVE